MKTVYLSGPITGLTYDEGKEWRTYAREALLGWGKEDILGLDPLRGKDYLRGEGVLTDKYLNLNPLSTPKGIVTRDRNDTMKADAMIVNLLGAERVSIGTVLEIGWADAARVPIVLVMEDGNIHDHAMVRELAGFVTTDLDEAIRVVLTILGAQP